SVLMVRTEPRLAIRTVDPGDAETLDRIARLEAAAYPVLQADTPDGFARFAERVRALAAETGTRVAIAELDGEAVGAMATYEFTMRLRERDARAAGLGSVAVSLAHKRRGIARAMVRRFLDDAHEQGASIALLHPFRLDFYRTLGFGYGTPTQRYRLAPATIDVRGARGTARILGARDLEAMLACDERVRATTNGLLARSPARLARLLAEPGLRYVGVDDDGTLRAFMQTSVRLGPEGSTNANELIVREVYAETPAHEAALLAYLRAQRDQFARIVLETQHEAAWLVSGDPRDGSDALVAPPATHRVAELGLGVMYRLVDVERAFAHLGASDAPFALRVDVADAFFPHTSGGWTFRFGPHGAPWHDANALPDAALRIGVADLSSLVAGSLRLREIVRRGLASLEPLAMFDRAARALDAAERPICTTRF